MRAARLSECKGGQDGRAIIRGEKARLLLGLASFNGPHQLILDEPANHLDIDSRAALIEAINEYRGAVILVSHDKYLLDACADRLWLVEAGTVKPFDGDIDDYNEYVLARASGGNGVSACSYSPCTVDGLSDCSSMARCRAALHRGGWCQVRT